MAGPTEEEDPPLFVGAKRFRGVGFTVWAGTNEAKVDAAGGGAPADAEYVLGASDGDLPNGRVATASTEITPDVGTTNVITWALNAASVAFSKLANLTGLSVLGRAANSAGVMAAITATAARQTLRANGAGAALEWGHPVEFRDNDNIDQGDGYSLQVVDGLNTTSSISLNSGVATIAWSVDDLPASALEDVNGGTYLGNITGSTGPVTVNQLGVLAGSGLTYGLGVMAVGAGDGIDVGASDVSVDVSDFAGTGLEDDGSNNLRLAYRGVQSSSDTGALGTIALNDDTTVFRWGGGAGDASIAGFSGNLWDGRRLIVRNIDGTAGDELTLLPDSAGTATNGFHGPGFGGSSDASRQVVLRNRGAATLTYDTTSARWYIEASQPLTEFATQDESGAGPFNNYTIPDLPEHLDFLLVMNANGQVWTGFACTSGNVSGARFRAVVGGALTGTVTLADSSGSSLSANRIETPLNRNMILRARDEVEFQYIGGNWRVLECIPRISDVLAADGITSASDRDIIINNGTDWVLENIHAVVSDRPGTEWWEDFEFIENDTVEFSATSSVALHFGNTHWGGRGTNGTNLEHIAGEAGHPGILRLVTLNTDNSFICIHRGGRPESSRAWIMGQDILHYKAVIRSTNTTTKAFTIGFSEDPSSVAITGTGNSHIMAFMFDSDNTSLDNNIQCVTRESDGTASVTDSGVSLASIQDTWASFEMLQTTVGTVVFMINGNVVATKSSQVPDTELLNCGICVYTRAASISAIDVDYVAFRSQALSR
jgi:hypothetical protein